MEVNIVCWNLKEKINLNDISNIFKDTSKEDEETYFFKLGLKLLKIDMFNSGNKDFKEKYINLKQHRNLIIMVKEINDININIIKEALLNECIIIVGKNNINDDEIYKKILIAPQLYYEEQSFDFKSFLFTLDNFYINDKFDLEQIINKKIIVGNNNNDGGIGEIPLFLLKRFNYLNIDKCKEVELNIYVEKELNLQDVAYIEDPLKEYLPYNCMLKIIQTIINKFSDKVYFSLISK